MTHYRDAIDLVRAAAAAGIVYQSPRWVAAKRESERWASRARTYYDAKTAERVERAFMAAWDACRIAENRTASPDAPKGQP